MVTLPPRRTTRPEKTGIRAPLGSLEQVIMTHIWHCPHDGCLAADVQAALEPTRPLALTTVLTTLDRLQKKGILRREREGKAYRYWATVIEEELQQRIVDSVLGNLLTLFPRAVATYFARPEEGAAAGAAAQQRLAALARQVEEMQRAEAAQGAPPAETPPRKLAP